MTMTECYCSEEFGPCEWHGEILVSRVGASSRTADELLAQFAHDCLALDPDCLSPVGREWLADADAALDKGRDPISGVAWISEEDEIARDGLEDLRRQLESYFADLWITWEDGYVIARVTGGPLATDTEDVR